MKNNVSCYPQGNKCNARNYDGPGKRRVNQLRFITAGTLETAVDARWWMGIRRGSSVVYCSVWVSPPLTSPLLCTSGYAKAGGCGYHMESAALEEAFASAGIQFDTAFGGAGEAAMKAAIEAVAAYLGVEGKVI